MWHYQEMGIGTVSGTRNVFFNSRFANICYSGIVVEQVVKSESLVEGEECWISNGVNGFLPAVIRLEKN